MKIQKAILTVAVATAMPFAAYAQSSTTSSSSTTTTIKKEETGVSDLKDTDQEITNAKLRAETGSKKKWSFRGFLNYEGSNLQKPLAASRPSISSDQGAPEFSNFKGLIGIKYRMDDVNSISFRTGIAYLRPFGGDMPDGRSKTEIADAILTWDNVKKVGDFQLVRSLEVERSTSREKQRINRLGYISPAITAIYSVGKTGLDVGMRADAYFYEYEAPTTAAVDTRQKQLFGLYPFVEYAFNDKVNLRTVFRYSSYASSRANPNTYSNIIHSQSLGVGIAVTRDFYMYPNVQFDPANNTSEYTNWGLTTYFNL